MSSHLIGKQHDNGEMVLESYISSMATFQIYYQGNMRYLVAGGTDVNGKDFQVVVGDLVHVGDGANRVDLDILLLVKDLDSSDNTGICVQANNNYMSN